MLFYMNKNDTALPFKNYFVSDTDLNMKKCFLNSKKIFLSHNQFNKIEGAA